MYVTSSNRGIIQSGQHSVAFNTNTKHFLSIINESAFGFVNSAVIMALSAFAAECRAAGRPAPPAARRSAANLPHAAAAVE